MWKLPILVWARRAHPSGGFVRSDHAPGCTVCTPTLPSSQIRPAACASAVSARSASPARACACGHRRWLHTRPRRWRPRGRRLWRPLPLLRSRLFLRATIPPLCGMLLRPPRRIRCPLAPLAPSNSRRSRHASQRSPSSRPSPPPPPSGLLGRSLRTRPRMRRKELRAQRGRCRRAGAVCRG